MKGSTKSPINKSVKAKFTINKLKRLLNNDRTRTNESKTKLLTSVVEIAINACIVPSTTTSTKEKVTEFSDIGLLSVEIDSLFRIFKLLIVTEAMAK